MFENGKNEESRTERRKGTGEAAEPLKGAAVVVLAGGASRRMAALRTHKALLPFSAGETFLEHILHIYGAAGCRRAAVVLAEAARHLADEIGAAARRGAIGAELVFHDDPAADRFASVKRGLAHLNGNTPVFLQDADRPFITTEVARALFESRPMHGYAAPEIAGRAGHPVLLSAAAAERLRFQSRETTLHDALRRLPRTLVPVAGTMCNININTPEEYRKYFGAIVVNESELIA